MGKRSREWKKCASYALAVACILAGLGLQTSGKADAQENGKPTIVTAPPATAASFNNVSVPMVDRDLSLADFPGMAPRPDLQIRLARVNEFIQNTPSDGQPATEKTEVYLAYTRTTLYAVFLCFDDHAALEVFD